MSMSVCEIGAHTKGEKEDARAKGMKKSEKVSSGNKGKKGTHDSVQVYGLFCAGHREGH